MLTKQFPVVAELCDLNDPAAATGDPSGFLAPEVAHSISSARPGQVWIPDELYPFPAAE
ncbi:hypothetical protein [Amycolatopsis sp.]|uniref:hypothetical protein n=1 Tax=Amycolatopsis sp. TaxID=37632 RepID=UPI00261DEDAD|nr:hypothetical protein [Amycolatopsis sp.]